MTSLLRSSSFVARNKLAGGDRYISLPHTTWKFTEVPQIFLLPLNSPQPPKERSLLQEGSSILPIAKLRPFAQQSKRSIDPEFKKTSHRERSHRVFSAAPWLGRVPQLCLSPSTRERWTCSPASCLMQSLGWVETVLGKWAAACLDAVIWIRGASSPLTVK